MKKLAAIFLFATLFLACNKTPLPISATCRFTKMIQGLNNDTVYLVSYDVKGRISAITDSILHTVYTVTYNEAGKLIKFNNGYSDFSVDYNADGMPLKITNVIPGTGAVFLGYQFIYEYNAAKQLVKRTQYSYDIDKWLPSEVRKYEFSNGDISRINSYSVGIGYDSTEITITDYNYFAMPNTLQQISYFAGDFSGMGLYNLLDIDFYFNKHLFKSSSFVSGRGTDTYSQQYLIDSSNMNVIKSVSQRIANGVPYQTFTRQFLYECR